MAIETAVYQQEMFSHNNKDLCNSFAGGNFWGCDFDVSEKFASNSFDFLQENSDPEKSPVLSDLAFPLPSDQQYNLPPLSTASSDQLETLVNKIPDDNYSIYSQQLDSSTTTSSSRSRSRRRRSGSRKNKEEIESQRMAHIAVERNRRKQMNEYLSILRGLMPDGYAQRGDQASIVGGAINYVKELEQELQFLVGQNHMNNQRYDQAGSSSSSSPFSEFFAYPQYSSGITGSGNAYSGHIANLLKEDNSLCDQENSFSAGDIEVTIVENHVNLKVRSRKWPKLLTKMVSGLQYLRLTTLHLNVTTADQIVLYSMNLKVEDDCKKITVDEIASAVNRMLERIQNEAVGLIG